MYVKFLMILYCFSFNVFVTPKLTFISQITAVSKIHTYIVSVAICYTTHCGNIANRTVPTNSITRHSHTSELACMNEMWRQVSPIVRLGCKLQIYCFANERDSCVQTNCLMYHACAMCGRGIAVPLSVTSRNYY